MVNTADCAVAPVSRRVMDAPGLMALIGEGRCADAVRLIRQGQLPSPWPVLTSASTLRGAVPPEYDRRRHQHPRAEALRRGHCRRRAPAQAPPTGKKVAIIGGGPAAWSCAYYLALLMGR